MTIAELLLAWYDANKRELPWRNDKDPYKIWVSEIMLQQTRVEAVKPYFARWIERFPDVETLAAASEEEVLYYWQGLGYYSRARNLLAGAREVAAEYNARIPEDRQEAARIKGIGEYTSGAIASIAYGKQETAVDGNVLRVFSRLFCFEGDIMKTQTRRVITKLVEAEISPERPGDFNQALMDLGSAVCVPKEPRCSLCPLSSLCVAYTEGCQRELPIRSKAKAPVPVRVLAGILEKDGKYLLRKRSNKGVLAGLWEFPSVELRQEENEFGQLMTAFRQDLAQTVTVGQEIYRTTHTFSHRIWDISFLVCLLEKGQTLPENSQAEWVKVEDWPKVSFAGPHRKMAALISKTIN